MEPRHTKVNRTLNYYSTGHAEKTWPDREDLDSPANREPSPHTRAICATYRGRDGRPHLVVFRYDFQDPAHVPAIGDALDRDGLIRIHFEVGGHNNQDCGRADIDLHGRIADDDYPWDHTRLRVTLGLFPRISDIDTSN